MRKKKLIFVFGSLTFLLTACGGGKDISSLIDSSSFNEPIKNPWVDSFPTNEINELNVSDFTIGADPYGFNISYYSDIYSRGFSYLTNNLTEGTELYLTKSDAGENAEFDDDPIEGKCNLVKYTGDGVETDIEGFNKVSGSGTEFLVNSHKVHIENLEKDTVYSYKLGSNEHYVYGVFKTEEDEPTSIKMMELSDAQTKDYAKLDFFSNTFKNGRITGGTDLDFIINGGDQFDQNMNKVDGNTIPKISRYAKAIEAIKDYKTSIPYLSAAGNHEPTSPYSQVLMNNMNFAGFTKSGGWYSFDYKFAHFVIVNSNDPSNADQLTWLENDLKNSDAIWKVVMTHHGLFSTGDHCSTNENNTVTEKFAPIFSRNHVDLVLQAHEHTYNKTLPYRWDTTGYSTTSHDTSIVNFGPDTELHDGVKYDHEPNGTYYVTTGAAGHRTGEAEASSGIYAEVVADGDSWKGLNTSKSFFNCKYKIENGKIKLNNKYSSYTSGSYTSEQDYTEGRLASGNVNANMFGILELTEETLSYKFYTSVNSEVKLFDTLNVCKD